MATNCKRQFSVWQLVSWVTKSWQLYHLVHYPNVSEREIILLKQWSQRVMKKNSRKLLWKEQYVYINIWLSVWMEPSDHEALQAKDQEQCVGTSCSRARRALEADREERTVRKEPGILEKSNIHSCPPRPCSASIWVNEPWLPAGMQLISAEAFLLFAPHMNHLCLASFIYLWGWMEMNERWKDSLFVPPCPQRET